MAVTGAIATRTHDEQNAQLTPNWRRVLPPTAVVATYFVLGLVAYWPVVPEISHHIFSGTGDLTLTVWYLGWVPHALTHGLNPFFSNAMFAPTGVNLAQNTEAPLLGLIAAPITWAFGPLVSTNLLLVLGMPISATAAFLVLRKWEVWGPAAALGGLIYGFSPYMVGQSFAHPVLTFVPLPPFIVMTVVSILQRRGPPRRLGIQLGLLVVAQYLISPEVLVTVAVLTGAALVFVALSSPSKVPQLARTAAGPIGISLVVAVVLLAYPVWMLLAGPQHVSGPTYPLINSYHNDLLSFVDHGLWQQVSLGMQSSWAGPLAMFESPEYGGYVGIPVLILTGFLVWRSRHSSCMQLSAALFITSALLSLGPFLTIHGRATHVPLPFWLLGHIPLIDNVLPTRISFGMDACLAAMIAFGLDDMRATRVRDHQHGSRRQPRTQERGAIIVTGVALVVLVATQLPQWPYVKPLAPVLPTSIRQVIPPGDPVAITYPYADGSLVTQPLLWQADDGYRFRLTGGYSFHPDPSGGGWDYTDPMSPFGLQRFLFIQENSCPPENPFRVPGGVRDDSAHP